jgi:hypothetical protein
VEITAAVGTRIELHGDLRDRIGHLIAVADTPGESAEVAENAISLIKPIIS